MQATRKNLFDIDFIKKVEEENTTYNDTEHTKIKNNFSNNQLIVNNQESIALQIKNLMKKLL